MANLDMNCYRSYSVLTLQDVCVEKKLATYLSSASKMKKKKRALSRVINRIVTVTPLSKQILLLAIYTTYTICCS